MHGPKAFSVKVSAVEVLVWPQPIRNKAQRKAEVEWDTTFVFTGTRLRNRPSHGKGPKGTEGCGTEPSAEGLSLLYWSMVGMFRFHSSEAVWPQPQPGLCSFSTEPWPRGLSKGPGLDLVALGVNCRQAA